ncbi:MAG: hypothetical protein OEV42_15215 [Deltaproteobacteria bacterium]|nr:hypothetical protein [Deltaproteobacteria bacterium]
METRRVKYGSNDKIRFALYTPDGKNIRTDVVFAAGDVTISKDGAAAANVAALPVYAANGFDIEWMPAAGELDAKEITLRIKDQDAAETWLECVKLLQTEGDANAMFTYDGQPSVNILGAAGSVQPGYAEEAGTFDLYPGDDISIPFTINGDMTGHSLYFYMKESSNDLIFAVEDKALSNWTATDGITSGTIDFASAETDSLIPAIYNCEIKSKHNTNLKVATVWSAKARLKKPVAKKTDVP